MLTTLTLLVAAVIGAAGLVLPKDDRIVHGVCVGNVALGDLTQAQAREAIDRAFTHDDQQLMLEAGYGRRVTTLHELGVAPDTDALVQRAYAVGREGSTLKRLMQIMQVRSSGITFTPRYTMNARQVRKLLNEMGKDVNLPPQDATAHWDAATNKLVVTSEQVGAKLDAHASLQLIQSAVPENLSAGREVPTELALSYAVKNPHITSEMLAPVDTMLGTFTTAYGSSTRNRCTNIETAAAAIDGTVLAPGETFSFNKIVGPRSEDNGFRTAPVIIDGQLSEGTGGGVCQVSTTLYNAVLLSNLPIVARSHHSLPSHYVAAGRDATVSYGAIDFRFRNNMQAPIVIEAKPSNRHLTMRILGQGPAPVVRIVTSDRQPRPGATITKNDPTLPKGKKIVEKGGTGLAITVTRIIGSGPDARSEVLSHDRYRGEPTVIRVGTGPAPVAKPTEATAAPTAPDAQPMPTE